MLRRLFGGRSKAESPPRQATHAWELQVGDFVKFGFVAPHGLSQAELQVAAVHALDLGGPQKIRRVITLDGGAEGRYSLWQDERSALAVAHEINRPVVERLFDVDEFARLFDPDQSPNLTLHRRQELPELEGWTTSVYRQEAAEQAYRHARDPALTTIDDQLGAGRRRVRSFSAGWRSAPLRRRSRRARRRSDRCDVDRHRVRIDRRGDVVGVSLA